MPCQPVRPRDPRTQFWVQSTNPALEGKLGSTFSLANGCLGLRGAHEEMPSWGRPEFYVSGTYTGGPSSLLGFHDPDHILTHPKRVTPAALAELTPDVITTLPNLPNPTGVRLGVAGVPFSFEACKVLSCERLLDTARALLRRCLVFRDAEGRRTRVDSTRFASFADRNLICLRYAVTRLGHNAPVEVAGFINRDVANPNGVVLWSETELRREAGLEAVGCVTTESGTAAAIAQVSTVCPAACGAILELFIIAGTMPLAEAADRARRAAACGFGQHQERHVTAYGCERGGADADWDGNPATVQGFNFGQMHLHMAFCYGNTDVGIPIKGLTGHGYRFLNFWDMDFHMFPYYLMTKPRQARLLLEYRYNQLPAYRENARRWGARGAQVPWETGVTGTEETAPWLCLQEREIHISADAAYMFKLYDELTPDHDAMLAMGAEFVLETARFYASRIRWIDEHQWYELPDIGCPDQYHTFADNNVFISLMARWNLEYAVSLAEDPEYVAAINRTGLQPAEVEDWRAKVAGLRIIQPDEDGIIEEFDGFFGLEPDLDGISEQFCRHSQAVKQPDVVAAFAHFEELFPLETRQRNWRFYADRGLHGSSLSLPGMAYAAARCGLNDEALYYLHKSTRMDLDDVNLDTERGIHVSGGAVEWSTVVFGFGGVTPRRECVEIRPNLPRQWRELTFTLHWQFQRLTVRLTHQAASFEAGAANDADVVVRLSDARPFALAPGADRRAPL